MTENSVNELKGFALDSGIDHRILIAILDNESKQNGFKKDGELKSRFEKHIFDEFVLVYDGRHDKHIYLPKFDYAWVHRHDLSQLKYLSTSFGIAQIMGYHYEMFDYPSPERMATAWRLSELMQITDFIIFCIKHRSGKFLKALQDADINKISRYYNGANYKRNHYAEKIMKFLL